MSRMDQYLKALKKEQNWLLGGSKYAMRIWNIMKEVGIKLKEICEILDYRYGRGANLRGITQQQVLIIRGII